MRGLVVDEVALQHALRQGLHGCDESRSRVEAGCITSAVALRAARGGGKCPGGCECGTLGLEVEGVRGCRWAQG
jgi:hypothetical protein